MPTDSLNVKLFDAGVVADPIRMGIRTFLGDGGKGAPKLVAFLASLPDEQTSLGESEEEEEDGKGASSVESDKNKIKMKASSSTGSLTELPAPPSEKELAAAKSYAEWTARACKRDGIVYELRHTTRRGLEEAIQEANVDESVHGILVYYPCWGAYPCFYGGTMDEFLRDTVDIRKDVEGLSHYYRGRLYRNQRYIDQGNAAAGPIAHDTFRKKCVLPCTPLAVVKILEYLNVYDATLQEGHRLTGTKVTIINRSDVVGRPLAAMLANDGAHVWSVDIDSMYAFQRGKLSKTSMSVEEACRASRVIVTGVPSPGYRLPVEWISPGTVVINVASHPNIDEVALQARQQTVLDSNGDTPPAPGIHKDEESSRQIIYVPRVGKVTVACLERNLMRLWENFHAIRETYWQ